MDNKAQQPTPEQLASWEKKYGKYHTLQSERGEVYIKKPDRPTLKLILNKLKSDPLGASETLLNTCWLHGDESLKEDDGFLLGLLNKLDDIIGVVTMEVKKN